jgi:hypothetical protein
MAVIPIVLFFAVLTFKSLRRPVLVTPSRPGAEA